MALVVEGLHSTINYRDRIYIHLAVFDHDNLSNACVSHACIYTATPPLIISLQITRHACLEIYTEYRTYVIDILTQSKSLYAYMVNFPAGANCKG